MCTYFCSIPTHEYDEGQKKMSGTLLVTQHIVLRQGLLLNLARESQWSSCLWCPQLQGSSVMQVHRYIFVVLGTKILFLVHAQ